MLESIVLFCSVDSSSEVSSYHIISQITEFSLRCLHVSVEEPTNAAHLPCGVLTDRTTLLQNEI